MVQDQQKLKVDQLPIDLNVTDTIHGISGTEMFNLGGTTKKLRPIWGGAFFLV